MVQGPCVATGIAWPAPCSRARKPVSTAEKQAASRLQPRYSSGSHHSLTASSGGSLSPHRTPPENRNEAPVARCVLGSVVPRHSAGAGHAGDCSSMLLCAGGRGPSAVHAGDCGPPRDACSMSPRKVWGRAAAHPSRRAAKATLEPDDFNSLLCSCRPGR